MSTAGWIILVLATMSAPFVGLGMGLLAAAAFMRCGDALLELGERPENAGRGFDLAAQPAVDVGGPLRNLPGLLLHARQRSFCVECVECESGKPRRYTILAKHAGAATMKLYSWGEHLRAVEELPADHGNC